MVRHFAFFGFCMGLALASLSARADDIYSVGGVRVDAIGATATEARDTAIVRGRAPAWAKLYRRLTRAKDWPRQPQLNDDVLSKIIRGFEIANEKRSSTHYIADMTYDFNAAEVRRILQQGGIPYIEAAGKRVLVIPLLAGAAKPFDPSSPWAQAWAAPDIATGVIPFVQPTGDAADMNVLSRPSLAQSDWATLSPLAARYGASEALIAVATSTPGAVTVNLVRVSPAGAAPSSLGSPQGNYADAAAAAANVVRENWKARSAVDYAQRSNLRVLVPISSGREWASIRSRLASVPNVANVSVLALTLNSGEIELSYVGQLAQLQDALAQQNLTLGQEQGMYSLRSAAPAETP